VEQKSSDPPANAWHWRAGHRGLSDNTIIDSIAANIAEGYGRSKIEYVHQQHKSMKAKFPISIF
jgi:ribonuclease HI